MEPFVVIIIFLFIALVIRLLAGSMDGGRIENYVREHGWKLIDKSWDPFGPGWFVEKNDRIYQIVYEDLQGDTHKANVKTSLFSGVYLTNDHVVKHAKKAVPKVEENLRSENERLKARIWELEKGQSE